jgi:hypothetical protein
LAESVAVESNATVDYLYFLLASAELKRNCHNFLHVVVSPEVLHEDDPNATLQANVFAFGGFVVKRYRTARLESETAPQIICLYFNYMMPAELNTSLQNIRQLFYKSMNFLTRASHWLIPFQYTNCTMCTEFVILECSAISDFSINS